MSFERNSVRQMSGQRGGYLAILDVHAHTNNSPTNRNPKVHFP
jgi:hypothetical protein